LIKSFGQKRKGGDHIEEKSRRESTEVGLKDRETDRQADRQTHTHTHTHTQDPSRSILGPVKVKLSL
jgi:hypothetical protein